MADVLKLVVDDFISVNHYLGYTVRGRHAVSYKTQEAKVFQKRFTEYVKEEVKKQGWLIDLSANQHYYVDAVFYFPRVDMDTNNYWKVAFDAITDSQVVWRDDNLACERVIKVMYDSKHPRIEYTIYKTDFIGVFDNREQLIEFEDKCTSCARYKKNCSLLKGLKEGRCSDDVTSEYVCLKYKQ